MTAAPRTEHRGYAIMYSMNEEVWQCSDLDLSAPKLSTLITKINKAIKVLNDERGVHCLYLNYSDTAIPALVVGIEAAQVVDYAHTGLHRQMKTEHKLTFMAVKMHNERASRSTAPLSAFLPDTPEVQDLLRQANAKKAQITKLNDELRKLMASIPRMKAEDFDGLKPDEQEDDTK